MCFIFKRNKEFFPETLLASSPVEINHGANCISQYCTLQRAHPIGLCAKVWWKKTFPLLLKFGLSFFLSACLCFRTLPPARPPARPPFPVALLLQSGLMARRRGLKRGCKSNPVFSAVPSALPRLTSKPGTLLRNSPSLLA